jgi:hypothetical protein
MGRGDRDDDRAPEPTEAREGRTDDRKQPVEIRELPERLTLERDCDTSGREHHLDLPTGPDREQVRDAERTYHLRGSEVDLLERAACFRSVFTDDLRRASGDESRAETDLRSLERQGLIESRTVTRLRDGQVADVVTVTAEGKALLDQPRSRSRRGSEVLRGLGQSGGDLARRQPLSDVLRNGVRTGT